MNKSDLLNWLHEQHQHWEALLDEFGPTRMGRPGVNGEWSMKDIVAHLTGWNHRLIASLQAAQRGEPEPPPPWPVNLQTDDEVNKWIYESNHGRSVQEVLDDSSQMFHELFAVVESLLEDVQVEIVRNSVGREFYPIWL